MSATFLLAITLLGPAHFPTDDIATIPASSEINGGQNAETCGWPTAVGVLSAAGLCSGTLVHPQIVIYAAHCGGGSTVAFGEQAGYSGGVSADCRTYPSYQDTNTDWAYCKLSQPVDLPVSPVAYGCEIDLLEPGRTVAAIGFGQPDAYSKSWIETELSGVTPTILKIPLTEEKGICMGDSGGPLLTELADGTWHAIGIASVVAGECPCGCPGEGRYARMDKAVAWIEESSGIDITPCHDPDGTWNPTQDCGGFVATGAQGHGSWNDWCSGTPTGGMSATCGAPFGGEDDEDAPTVTIVSPADGASFDAPAQIDIEIDADDGDGWGIKLVRLEIDGVDVGIEDTSPPYTIAEASFPGGVYTLVATAEDLAGNVGTSDQVVIGVGEEPPSDDDGGDGDDDGDGGDDGSGDGNDDGGDDDDGPDDLEPGAASDDRDGGCSCTTSPNGPGSAWLSAFGLLVLLRRRSLATVAVPLLLAAGCNGDKRGMDGEGELGDPGDGTGAGHDGHDDGGDAGDDGGVRFDVMPPDGGEQEPCVPGDGDCPDECEDIVPEPCDDGTSDPFLAIGITCPDMPPVQTSVEGSDEAWGVLTKFGQTSEWDPTHGQAMAVIASGFIEDIPLETPPNDDDVHPTHCNDDLDEDWNEAYDPGTTLPDPLIPIDVGGDCAANPGLVGTGDCSNSIQGQFDQGHAAYDYTELRVVATVPEATNSFSFDLAYFTTEYPYYYDTEYNDMFVGWLESTKWTGNISFDELDNPISLNASFLDFKDDGGNLPEFTGTCMRQHAATKWLTTTAPVSPGEPITVVFAIFDLSDSILDSYVLLDNWRWGCEGTDKPHTKPVG